MISSELPGYVSSGALVRVSEEIDAMRCPEFESIIQLDIADVRQMTPSSQVIATTIGGLVEQLLEVWPEANTESLLVWADDLAQARAHDFGRRLDNGKRVTARQSVDLEVTESFRALQAEGRGWQGPLWVCTGAEPGSWLSTVSWYLTIKRTDSSQKRHGP